MFMVDDIAYVKTIIDGGKGVRGSKNLSQYKFLKIPSFGGASELGNNYYR